MFVRPAQADEPNGGRYYKNHDNLTTEKQSAVYVDGFHDVKTTLTGTATPTPILAESDRPDCDGAAFGSVAGLVEIVPTLEVLDVAEVAEDVPPVVADDVGAALDGISATGDASWNRVAAEQQSRWLRLTVLL